ncbi:MAG: 1,4-alpha-glucan branching enzyme [Planctomyces sp.]|nr:1,4-alpha-glucan branching enzyme [Planctomyces sp.]
MPVVVDAPLPVAGAAAVGAGLGGGLGKAEREPLDGQLDQLSGPLVLTEDDLYLFNEGSHYRLFDKLGAHLLTRDGVAGVMFRVWAPNAQRVSVVGQFNGWDTKKHPLRVRGGSGIWEGFIPGDQGAVKGALYKYQIESLHNGYQVAKTDPFGFLQECPPATASRVWDLEYAWNDAEWMRTRRARQSLDAPMSIYECHLGSWMRVAQEGNRSLTYREAGERLAEYCVKMGFTHVEFLPLTEHPLYRSWGYQTVGYFAPTSRFGHPQDAMAMIDTLHRAGVGVILDWVPSHFPTDEHGLGYFDGTHLYEHADPRQGFHPDWKSAIFNYGRHEVRAFLISSAMFWLEKYHIDGLRVDAVASMLYLDYGRQEGEWMPNRYGGKENVDAIDFMRRLNTEVYTRFPDVQTIAEESTAWALVSKPPYVGGLGFGLKWDMGWMHDTLKHLSRDPVHRRFHHNELTFRGMYMHSENYVLPLSHDEVVHMKGSLLNKMAGDRWQKFANLRLVLCDQWCQPGKKLLFMGGEIGQWSEFSEEGSVDWHVLNDPLHAGVQRLVADLNRVYRAEPALHAGDCRDDGFVWSEPNDAEGGVLAWVRRGRGPDGAERVALVVMNTTPLVREPYRVGVPIGGRWDEVLNSDAPLYGGSGVGNMGGLGAMGQGWRGWPDCLELRLPPLGCVILRPAERA